MNHLNKLWMKPHGLYVWTYKSSIRLKVSELKFYVIKWCTLERLSKSVKQTNFPSALTYDEMNIHVKGWVIMKIKCVKVNEWGDNMIRG